MRSSTSIVGTWVVSAACRSWVRVGAWRHPGIALAVLWGSSPVVGRYLRSGGGLVAAVSARTTVRDTPSGFLRRHARVGVVIVSRAGRSRSRSPPLFGDVLGVTSDDIRTQVIAAAIVVIVSVIFYRPFLALVQRDKALTSAAGSLTGVLLSLALSIVATSR